MSTGGALLFLLGLACCSLVVLAPLFTGPGRKRESREDDARERLQLRYQALLTTLRDLDEDHLTGKVDPATHATERERLLQAAEALLAELDALAREHGP